MDQVAASESPIFAKDDMSCRSRLCYPCIPEVKAMRTIGLLIVVLVALTSGCVSNSDSDSELESLWEQGYGFNNPNAERLKKGLPPEEF